MTSDGRDGFCGKHSAGARTGKFKEKKRETHDDEEGPGRVDAESFLPVEGERGDQRTRQPAGGTGETREELQGTTPRPPGQERAQAFL